MEDKTSEPEVGQAFGAKKVSRRWALGAGLVAIASVLGLAGSKKVGSLLNTDPTTNTDRLNGLSPEETLGLFKDLGDKLVDSQDELQLAANMQQILGVISANPSIPNGHTLLLSVVSPDDKGDEKKVDIYLNSQKGLGTSVEGTTPMHILAQRVKFLTNLPADKISAVDFGISSHSLKYENKLPQFLLDRRYDKPLTHSDSNSYHIARDRRSDGKFIRFIQKVNMFWTGKTNYELKSYQATTFSNPLLSITYPNDLSKTTPLSTTEYKSVVDTL